MPLVSIITPIYNVEKYLHRCIDSVLAQSFRDYELILVDDGSSDKSGAICDEYAASDSRIRVIHKTNGGVSSARNTGLDHAKGKYCTFCDSDDYVEPEWLEQLLYQIQNHPQSWCFCGCHCVDANGAMLEENCVFHTEPTYEAFPISQYKQVYETNYSALLWIRIFEMDIIRQYGIRFDENISISEDVLFCLEYGKYCKEFAVVNLPLYNHRIYLNNEADHLDGKYPREMFYINKRIYSARKPLVTNENRLEFETDFFYRFINDIKKLSTDPGQTKENKINSIRNILRSSEFRTTLRNADTSKENWKLLLILKLRLARTTLSLFHGE